MAKSETHGALCPSSQAPKRKRKYVFVLTHAQKRRKSLGHTRGHVNACIETVTGEFDVQRLGRTWLLMSNN